jgi:calcineurin-like phosphoesterase family protein
MDYVETDMKVTTKAGEPLRANLNDAFVISDTHFNHVNIVKYEPIRQTLGADHNVVMVRRWRETVPENGVVLHVGDLALGKSHDFHRIADQLTGIRKLLILGNHDKRSRAWYAEHGFEVIPELWIEHEGWRIHVTHYPDQDPRNHANPKMLSLHGHIHSQSLDSRRFINCSVEVIDFRPQKLTALLDARISELGASAVAA